MKKALFVVTMIALLATGCGKDPKVTTLKPEGEEDMIVETYDTETILYEDITSTW